jgi:hypothetical protein
MLRITVQLIPFGQESKARTLATMEIANDGTGDTHVGNYTGILHGEYTGSDGRRGAVTGFMRQRQSVWSLVGAFLKLFGHTGHSPKQMRKLSEKQADFLTDSVTKSG